MKPFQISNWAYFQVGTWTRQFRFLLVSLGFLFFHCRINCHDLDKTKPDWTLSKLFSLQVYSSFQHGCKDIYINSFDGQNYRYDFFSDSYSVWSFLFVVVNITHYNLFCLLLQGPCTIAVFQVIFLIYFC